MKKAIVAVAFLGLVAMPMAAMAQTSDPAAEGTATNNASWDTGMVYQNSSAKINTNTQSLSIATDPLKGFDVGFHGYHDSGYAYDHDSTSAAVGGAIGGAGFIDNAGFLGGFIAGYYSTSDKSGYGANWNWFGADLDINGSLNVVYSNSWAHQIVNSEMAGDAGYVDMQSATTSNATLADPAGQVAAAGTLNAAAQKLSEGSGGSFTVGGANFDAYNCGGGFGYASGGGGSQYKGFTASVSGTGTAGIHFTAP